MGQSPILPPPASPEPKSRWAKIIWITLGLLLLTSIFFLAGAIYGFITEQPATNTLAKTLTVPLKEKVNVLVLGVDERNDDAGRSDTIFVVTVNPQSKKLTMVSIPRDTRVKIPGHGWDKINHAFAYGGSRLSRASVENLLGISIDYTVEINTSGFVRMIDILGGIPLTVDKAMHYSDPYDDNGGLYIDLRPGTQRLNGQTAVEYVRYRDEEGDIGRVARQQKFLQALVNECTKPQIITKLPEIISQFASTVKTDMPIKKMISLIPIVSEAAKNGLQTEWVTGTPAYLGEVSYWLPDIRALRTKMAIVQGYAFNENYRQATERLAREYELSIPRDFEVAMAAADNKHSYEETKSEPERTRKTPSKAGKRETETPDSKSGDKTGKTPADKPNLSPLPPVPPPNRLSQEPVTGKKVAEDHRSGDLGVN